MLCVPAGLTGHINEALVKVVRLVAAYSDSGFGGGILDLSKPPLTPTREPAHSQASRVLWWGTYARHVGSCKGVQRDRGTTYLV